MALALVLDTLAAAQQVYRTQLSRQRLFVPTDEVLDPGIRVQVTLSIEETGGRVTVPASVFRRLDAATAREHDLGEHGGVVVAFDLSDEVKGPLRDLLTGKLRGGSSAPPLDTRQLAADVRAYLDEATSADHYGALRIPRTAAVADVRAAYLKLIRRFHPDNYFGRIDDQLQASLEIAYQRITTAFEVLVDRRKRDAYDIEIGNFASTEGGSSAELKRQRAELERYKRDNAPRIRKAKALWDAALADEQAGRLKEARSKVKLAIDFDPRNPMFPRKLDELERRLS